MFASIYEALVQWNKTTENRVKLQHGYLMLAIVVLVIAGLVSLFDYDAGQRLAQFAFAALVICVANAIIWALLDSFVLARLGRSRQVAKRK